MEMGGWQCDKFNYEEFDATLEESRLGELKYRQE